MLVIVAVRNMGEYSSKKSLSCQTSDFVNPYITNFVLEHYKHFLGYFENLELKTWEFK